MTSIAIAVCSLFILLGFEIRYRQLKTQITRLNEEVEELNKWAVFCRTPNKTADKKQNE